MKVVAVLVAYNRKELMLQAIDALWEQTRRPDAIVVVDNASTDGSGDAASAHRAHPHVVTLPRNTGGAGGFAAGMAHAIIALNAGALWVMDDDTIPTPTALEALLNAWDAYPGDLAIASSKVVWTDGRDHPMNTPRTRLFASARARARARQAGARPIRTGSFVSMLVATAPIMDLGLPLADYFIWNDDLEFSARLLRHANGIFVPGSVSVHHTPRFAGALDNPGERFFFEVRNKTWTFLRRRVFGPVETLAYGGYTLMGWAKAMVRASDRKELRAGLRRGLGAALRHGPRPTAEVLASMGPVSAEVAAADLRARP